MLVNPIEVDVLCVGHASYDLVFSVMHHPGSDEKMVADSFISCGGGPAANAAVMVSKLGLRSAFVGYLGRDLYGEKHCQELQNNAVVVDKVVRGPSPTPLSMVLVKPDGKRALINYKGETKPLPEGAVDFSAINAKVILFDGHEPLISTPLARYAKEQGISTVLDAGSVHEGTLALMGMVDYLVCSEKFALQLTGDEETALSRLAAILPNVVITLGERGLIWQRGEMRGALPAFSVNVVDTTGAGDAFHGAFATAVASGKAWTESLRYASAAGALCCTKAGARYGLPTYQEHWDLFKHGR
ncbi:carbohydrate kinase family protein [Methyloglobulus sp.]|uniref:carbohydrate kinase family protein n=1 Tax=Methyloglobulus sp. TaxID=2518622 RepID=UPI0039899CDB